MKTGIVLFLFLAGAVSGLAEDKKSASQACADEETMVTDYQKGISDLVGTVHKEKLEEFERAFHRKSCLNKLNLCEGILDTANACLDDTLKNSSTSKADAESYRAKRDAYSKLKARLIQYRDSLKSKEEDKAAKALIETFDLAN
jgi:soluble cytochrome b562